MVIVDYQSGNLHSAAKAFERAAAQADVGARIVVSGEPDDLDRADRVVLPGVGAFADCKRGLEANPRLRERLDANVLQDGKPFFGICVGMQLMASRGHEFGLHDGLGWLDGDVVALEPDDPSLKIPHMGWNTLQATLAGAAHPLLRGLATGENGDHAYFVHGFHLKPRTDERAVLLTSDYGGIVHAAVGFKNLFGTQFHPEKSQRLGLRLIANFLTWEPAA